MANEGLFYKFLLWREKRIKEKHFILIISFIVGLCTAAAAIILKQLIHFIQHLLTGNFNADGVNYLYLLYPVIGILLAGLFVKYIVRDDISHGVTKILYAISQRKSRIKPHNTWTSIVASSAALSRWLNRLDSGSRLESFLLPWPMTYGMWPNSGISLAMPSSIR